MLVDCVIKFLSLNYGIVSSENQLGSFADQS